MDKLKLFRIKHIPTGMYYCPNRHIQIRHNGEKKYVKSNLSKKGKIYQKKPSLSWIGHVYYNHLTGSMNGFDEPISHFNEEEWEIEEVGEVK